MKRFGAVIVFKDDVSKEDAARALRLISHFLDLPTVTPEFIPTGEKKTLTFGTRKVEKDVYRTEYHPYDTADALHEFDDSHGMGPVWYIP